MSRNDQAPALVKALVHTITRDVRLALRLLLKSPGFTVVAVLVLALGIGANTAMFSIVNAMLLTPIPAQARDIVGVYNRDTARPDSYRAFSWPAYTLVRGGREVFAEVLAQTMTMVGVSEGERTRRAFVAVVTANYFSTLGVRLAAGREFTAGEERPGANEAVVIVGHQFARRAGFEPASAVGQTVRINARDYTIVGVAPEGFTGTMALLAPELWLPLGMYERVADRMFTDGERADLTQPTHRPLMLVGRLQPGLSVENAGAKLEVLSRLVKENEPDGGAHVLQIAALPRTAISTRPQNETQTSTLAAVLMGMSGLVLLIACLNLANMLLARGTSRRKEIALRLALGSGRWRVIAQLLTESLLIALAGGAAGLLLAIWSTRLLTATFAAALPLHVAFDGTPDGRVLAAALGFAIASTLLAGLVPAWRVTKPDVLPDLKEQPADPGGGGRRFSMRNALVIGQVALSLALLTAAGLFMRGAVKASAADPGFPLEGGLVASLEPALAGYDEPRSRAAFRTVLARVRQTPGVHAASLASIVPFGDFQEGSLVQKAGTPRAPDGQAEEGVSATQTIVTADYFDTLRIPVLRGRGFTTAEEEDPSGARVAVIDETLARRLFGDEDPLGVRVQLSRTPEHAIEVVGIVAGIRHSLFDRSPEPHIYLPFGQHYRGSMNLHVRAAGGARALTGSLMPDIREQVRAAEAGVPLINLRTLEQHRDGSIGLWVVNTGARLFSTFGAVALVLAVIGVYGVRSYLVSRRTREIGIRMALGASASQVLWMILRESLALTAVGVALGLLLALGVAKGVSGMLYEVSAVDPLVFAAAPILLAASALAAALVPARRAARIAPLTALRSE